MSLLPPTLIRLLKQEATPLLLAAGAWAGALLFFLWPTNPPLAWGVTLLGAGLLALVCYPLQRLGLGFISASLFFTLGFAEIAFHEPFPWVQASARSHWVVGEVQAITPQPDNPKRVTLRLSPIHLFNLPEAENLQTLRLGVWATQTAGITLGSTVAVPVKLLAPEGPMMPTERDSRLWQWLNPTQSGAFASGRLELTASATPYLEKQKGFTEATLAYLQTLRTHITSFTQTLGQGVPTALLVGDQTTIPEATKAAYRATGLSHLIAISGMQLSLVGLGLFWLLRYAGAAIPTLALRVNLKLWAAIGALLGVMAYTVLAGASPSVVRASLMVGIVLIAVLAGRVRGLLRAWAMANLCLLAIQPHLALSAGLQLSSIATFALALWVANEPTPHGILGWARATVLSTLVAGAATAPIAIAHFGMQAPLGLLANSLAIPLMTLATYAGFVALLLWPLGLQALALEPMAWLTNLTTHWAQTLAHLQPATEPTLGLPAAALMAVAGVAVLWAALNRRWRWLAFLALMQTAALWSWAAYAPQPILIVADNANTAFLRQPDATYTLLWAERVSGAKSLARRGKLTLTESVTEPPCCADPLSMPPNAPEFYAYAQQWPNDTWKITPHRCGRPWQAITESCQKLLQSMPESTTDGSPSNE